MRKFTEIVFGSANEKSTYIPPEIEYGILLDPGEVVCRKVECTDCKGKGSEDLNLRGPNYMPVSFPCRRCNSTGKVYEEVTNGNHPERVEG